MPVEQLFTGDCQNHCTRSAEVNLAEVITLDGRTYDARLVNVVLAITSVREKALNNAKCYDE